MRKNRLKNTQKVTFVLFQINLAKSMLLLIIESSYA